MQLFSGLDYLRIDISNQYGMDKETWDNRLLWFHANESKLAELVSEADEPYMMSKAIMAYEDSLEGKEVGHNMYLDATASGISIMAVLSGCYETAKKVNLVNTGNREDVYGHVADAMDTMLDTEDKVNRSLIKQPLMTHFYCKVDQEDLNDNQKEAFYILLKDSFTGAEEVKDLIQSYWNPNALEHSWVMPDGHKAICKSKEMVNAKVEIDELDTTFTYRFKANNPTKRSSSLAPNVIHAIDGYIVREMIRRANGRGFELVHVHDAFTALPQYMNIVRQNYIDILCEIADSDLLADILSQISGTKVEIEKTTNDLSKYIRESEYSLS